MLSGTYGKYKSAAEMQALLVSLFVLEHSWLLLHSEYWDGEWEIN
jgi:hypothetical protein